MDIADIAVLFVGLIALVALAVGVNHDIALYATIVINTITTLKLLRRNGNRRGGR